MSKILPFAEFGAFSEEKLEQLGFHFTALHLDKTKDGWLRLYCTWNSDQEKMLCRDKYPTLECTSFEHSACSKNFSFPIEVEDKEYDYKGKVEITLGIYQEDENKSIDYSPKFHENLKYGVLVWFAPKTWNNGEGDEELFRWESNED